MMWQMGSYQSGLPAVYSSSWMLKEEPSYNHLHSDLKKMGRTTNIIVHYVDNFRGVGRGGGLRGLQPPPLTKKKREREERGREKERRK